MRPRPFQGFCFKSNVVIHGLNHVYSEMLWFLVSQFVLVQGFVMICVCLVCVYDIKFASQTVLSIYIYEYLSDSSKKDTK